MKPSRLALGLAAAVTISSQFAPGGTDSARAAGADRSADEPQRQRADGLQPRRSLSKGARPVQPAYDHRLVVKFRDDLRARAADAGAVVSLAGARIDIATELAARHGAGFSQLIQVPQERLDFMERRAALMSGTAQPDLAGMMHVHAPADQLQAVAEALHASELVEWVQFEQIAPPPPVLLGDCVDIPPTTPSYVSLQTYRGPNPGLNMDAFWDMGDARGAGIKVADCEYWFDGNHEDLCGIIPEPGQTPHPNVITNGWHHHGTAVLGEMVSAENDYGCTGLVPDAQAYFFPEWTVQGGFRRVTAIANAIATVDAGDIVLLEMQTTGAGGDYGPAELSASVWTVVKNGTDAGVVVVGAAGNGNQNLDSAPYANYMGWGDSGAIIVGAGSANAQHNKLSFSTYGSRVNVQGWGHSVFTLGYGSYAQHGGDPSQAYTSSFNGTSSASPFVAAAAVALQSYAVANLNRRLTPAEVRQILIDTGHPQGTGGHIGPFPNMVAAGNVILEMALPNNTCDDRIKVFDGSTALTTQGASTTGPNEPNACSFFGDATVQNDVWFAYTATCAGTLTIDLCDAAFYTKVAVYGACPTGPGQVLACNAAGCGSHAKLTMSVTEGQSLVLRVGGHFGATGQATMVISCTEFTCPADLDGNGQIDVQDLLSLLGAWGQCAGCPADLNDDGVVDVQDFLLLLSAWGPCQ